jgi:hypothetical protein
VSRFHAVRKAVAVGKYKFYAPEGEDINPDGSVKDE